jgi:serine/threonine protein kinase
LVGTPDYMAPEQLQAQPLSPATDIYALGMVLFELLVGRLPFAEEPTLTRALKRLQGPALDASTGAAELPPKLTRLIARCLAVDPADRPQSAAELLQELTALERELALPAPSSASPSAEPRRTTSARAMLVAVGTIVVATGAVVALAVRRTKPAVVVSAPPGQAVSRPTPSLSSSNANPAPGAGPAAPAETTAVTNAPRADESAKGRGPRSGASTPFRPQRASTADGVRSLAPSVPSCTPPYYFDSDGFRVYRKECL